MIRRFIIIVAAVAMVAVVIAGCGSGSSSSTSTSGSQVTQKTLALGFNNQPMSLDFTHDNGAAIPEVLLDNVYQGLVRLDNSGNIVPLLAKSWTVSPDRKTYDFKLQTGVTFSNGDKFTANDVKFSFDRVNSSAWTISLKTYMAPVESVQVVSPNEVKVHLKTPSNGWLYNMASRVGAIFDPDAVSNLANQAVGTGPYVVSNFSRGYAITLTRRNNYWGQEPAIKTVVFRYYSDPNAESTALLSGNINAIIGVGAPNLLAPFKSNKKFVISVGSTTGKMVLSMNNKSGVFTNKLVRQAVCYAIDRKALLKLAMDGYGMLIGSMVPPTDPWYDASLANAYPYNPAKAKELLAQAGYSHITVRFEVPSIDVSVQVAPIIKSYLAAVGIDAKIQILQFPAQWLTQVFTDDNYDMSVIDHVEARDLVTYGQPSYYWGYNNPTVQKLLTEGDEGTPQQQITDYRKVSQIISADAVSDWLFLFDDINISQVGLQGIPSNMIGEAEDITGVSWR